MLYFVKNCFEAIRVYNPAMNGIIAVGLIPATPSATMQRHILTFLILALAVCLPARASHITKHGAKAKPAKPVAVAVQPLSKPVASSKGARLVASSILPGGKPASKIVTAKPAKAAPLVAAAVPANAMPATAPIAPVGSLARLTAYWTEEDPWTAKHESSTGARLQEGFCAVDPKLIPYGSLVNIPGGKSYMAVDTGSAVISRQAAIGSGANAAQRNALVIDLFFETRKDAENFAAHGPAFATISWTKPLTAADSPNNPRALPMDVPRLPAGTVYMLAEAPTMADMRMPMNFRMPQL
jgi:3D (Asp-Asp-Asp) domain-containing protein